jgi:hypothetical protein
MDVFLLSDDSADREIDRLALRLAAASEAMTRS